MPENNENQQKSFSVNFAVPDIIHPNETFSCTNELKQEWEEIVDRNFPSDLNEDVEKDNLLGLEFEEINWDGENFEFKLSDNFNDNEKITIAYVLARAVQQEHYLPEIKLDVNINTEKEKRTIFF